MRLNSEELSLCPHILLPSPTMEWQRVPPPPPLVVVFLLNEIISHPPSSLTPCHPLAQSRSEGPPQPVADCECSGREKKHTIRHRWLSASWCPARLPLQRAILPPLALPASVIQMRDQWASIPKVTVTIIVPFIFCSSSASWGQILFFPFEREMTSAHMMPLSFGLRKFCCQMGTLSPCLTPLMIWGEIGSD